MLLVCHRLLISFIPKHQLHSYKGFQMEQNTNNKYLRLKGAADYVGVAGSTIWLYSREKKITPIKLSERVTVWAVADLEAFIASRMLAV